MKILISIILISLLSGCLKTRSELRDSGQGNMRTDASGSYVAGNMGQQQRAQIDSRFFEIDRDFRELYGKIEVMERKIEEGRQSTPTDSSSASNVSDDKIKSLEKRISTLEEALLAIDKKISSQSGQKSGSLPQTKATPKGHYARGELLFEQKKYDEAIVEYDKYRKKFPKGRKYAQATLKMGLCFQKLKMNKDATAFYQEVIQRYPNTKVSLTAKENLKKL